MTVTNKFPAGIDLTTAYHNEHVGMPVVDNTSDIDSFILGSNGGPRASNPFYGQMVFSKSNSRGNNGVFRYARNVPNGIGGYTTGWSEIIAGDGSTSAARPDARYENKVAQSIPNNTDTAVTFASMIYDSDNIYTDNVLFSPYFDGLYLVTASLRFLGNAGGGVRGLHMEVLSSGTPPTTPHCAARQANVGSAPVTLSCSTVVRLRFIDYLRVVAYQNCGAALNTDVAFGGTNHVSLTWLRPLTA